jgi:hypothetical protein
MRLSFLVFFSLRLWTWLWRSEMMKENLPPLVFEELWHKEEAKKYKWRLVPTELVNPLNHHPLAALYPTALRLIFHRKIGFICLRAMRCEPL